MDTAQRDTRLSGAATRADRIHAPIQASTSFLLLLVRHLLLVAMYLFLQDYTRL